MGKTKINGVFGQVKLEQMKELVENEGMDPARPNRKPSRPAARHSSRPSRISPA